VLFNSYRATDSRIAIIIHVLDLEQLRVLFGFDPLDLVLHFGLQFEQAHRDRGIFGHAGFIAELIGVEPDIDPFTREGVEQIVVPDLFVHRVVGLVLVFVSLDGKHRVANELAVIDAAADRTIAVVGINRLVVAEAFEMIVDEVSCSDLLRFAADLVGEGVGWEHVGEAESTVSFVFFVGCDCACPVLAFASFIDNIHHGVRFTV